MAMIVTDLSATGRLTTGERALTSLTSKSVAREYKYGMKISSREIKNFLVKLGEIAVEKAKEFEKFAEERKNWLSKEYEKLFPMLKEAINSLK